MRKALLGFLLLFPAWATEPSALAIRDARVVTGDGAVLEKATVVVRGGLIEAVGADITPAAGVWIVDGKGLTVYPGLIDALSSWGLPSAAPPGAGVQRGSATPQAQPQTPPARGPEDRPSNTSWVKAADLLQTSDRRIESARAAGFTTAIAFPPNGIFAGQVSAINLAGERAGDMVVSPSVGQYLTLRGAGFSSFPGSLMGVIAYIRQTYLDAAAYRIEKAAYESHRAGRRRPAYDRAIEGLLDSPRVLLPADRAVEIARVLDLASELKLRPVIYGGHEAYRALDVLQARGAAVLVNLKWPERDREADPDTVDALRTLELRERAPSAPAALAKAGIPFAFYSGTVERPRDLLRAAKKAIDAGLSPADALGAFTLGAARIYGLDDRLGSIAPGKIANLIVTDGDLFGERTRVKYVFIDGVKFEPPRDTGDDAGGGENSRPAPPAGGQTEEVEGLQ
jgi:hypothetical protein